MADDIIAHLVGHEDEFDAVVFSCGDAVPVFAQNADKPYNIDLMSVLKAFGEKGKILIGHCAAGMLFDFAGVTEGKKLAVHPLAKPAITKGQATDDKSVVDGNLFTAQDEKFVWTMLFRAISSAKSLCALLSTTEYGILSQQTCSSISPNSKRAVSRRFTEMSICFSSISPFCTASGSDL